MKNLIIGMLVAVLVSMSGISANANTKSAVTVSKGEAQEVINTFLSSNLSGYEAGSAELSEGIRLSAPLYYLPITLSDGTRGSIFVDATTGKPAGILFDNFDSALTAILNEGKQVTLNSTSKKVQKRPIRFPKKEDKEGYDWLYDYAD